MTLLEKQWKFSELIPLLIIKAEELGFMVSLGEIWRPPETANLMDKTGMGVLNSLHTLRLAIDINLFKDGKYLTKKEDYSDLGLYWKSLSGEEFECCWGGDFASEDANHFSIAHMGVR